MKQSAGGGGGGEREILRTRVTTLIWRVQLISPVLFPRKGFVLTESRDGNGERPLLAVTSAMQNSFLFIIYYLVRSVGSHGGR